MANRKYIIPEILRGKLNKTIEYHDNWCEETRAELNNNQTAAEKQVCQYLTKEGIEFIENFPIYTSDGKKYFIDFVLPGNIALEIDGGYHFQTDQIEKDKIREEDLTSIGYKVVRLLNEECKSKKSFFTNFNVEYKAPSEKRRFDKIQIVKEKEHKEKIDRLRKINKKIYTTDYNDESIWKVVVPKTTFEYLTEGLLTKDEFCTLMNCVYNFKEKGESPIGKKLPSAVNMAWNKHLLSTNYSKFQSIIYNSIELTPDEKVMLAYLTNRANYFNKEEDWFGVPLCDFASDIGFTDHHKVSDVREKLKEKGLIDFKRGGNGKPSLYRIYFISIYKNLTSRYDVTKA